MFTIKKVVEFDASHRLYHNGEDFGLCGNIHGHRYKVEVQMSVFPDHLADNNMLVNFGEISSLIKDIYDHAIILNIRDPLNEYLCGFKGNLKLMSTSSNPTAEKIAQVIYTDLENGLKLIDNLVNLEFVRLWETPSAYAEYKERKNEII